MSAQREAAIQSVVAALTSPPIGPSVRVLSSRVRPVKALPVVLVYALGETAEVYNASPRELRRTVDLAVQVVVKADLSAETACNTLGEAIEKRLRRPPHQWPAPYYSDLLMTRSDLVRDGSGETEIISLALRYDLVYYTLDVAEDSEAETIGAVHIEAESTPALEAVIEFPEP